MPLTDISGQGIQIYPWCKRILTLRVNSKHSTFKVATCMLFKLYFFTNKFLLYFQYSNILVVPNKSILINEIAFENKRWQRNVKKPQQYFTELWKLHLGAIWHIFYTFLCLIIKTSPRHYIYHSIYVSFITINITENSKTLSDLFSIACSKIQY